jgi:hypothetical protein
MDQGMNEFPTRAGWKDGLPLFQSFPQLIKMIAVRLPNIAKFYGVWEIHGL